MTRAAQQRSLQCCTRNGYYGGRCEHHDDDDYDLAIARLDWNGGSLGAINLTVQCGRKAHSTAGLPAGESGPFYIGTKLYQAALQPEITSAALHEYNATQPLQIGSGFYLPWNLVQALNKPVDPVTGEAYGSHSLAAQTCQIPVLLDGGLSDMRNNNPARVSRNTIRVLILI